MHSLNQELEYQSLNRQQKRYRSVKRVVDTIFALLALFPLLILTGLVALLMKLANPKEQVFFVQERIGLNEDVFPMIKFRTMKESAPKDIPTCQLEHPESYYLRFGKILRRTSIDELPQIYNVLRGEMSWIGPRPLLPEEEPIQSLRKQVGVYQIRPGITGLAQINGRDYLPDEQKILYDAAYLKNFSLRQDVSILFHSISYVLTQQGIKKD